jgi:hypothetical protein
LCRRFLLTFGGATANAGQSLSNQQNTKNGQNDRGPGKRQPGKYDNQNCKHGSAITSGHSCLLFIQTSSISFFSRQARNFTANLTTMRMFADHRQILNDLHPDVQDFGLVLQNLDVDFLTHPMTWMNLPAQNRV